MKLYIRQKIFTLFDEFDVYGENGEALYKVKNHGILSHKFEFYNLKTGENYKIEESLFRFFNRFEIFDSNGNLIDTAVQEFSLFKFFIHFEKLGWCVKSTWPPYNFSCKDKTDNLVFSVNKKIFSFTDYYEIEIYPPYNVDLAVIIMICMDALMCHNNG